MKLYNQIQPYSYSPEVIAQNNKDMHFYAKTQRNNSKTLFDYG